MFSLRGAGCLFLLHNNPENHFHRQRNRSTEQPLAPTHFCLIWRAGRSQLSFQSRVRRRLCLTHQGPGQPGDRPSPWASCHHTVSSSSGTPQGPQTEAGTGWQSSYTHREEFPDTSKQRSLPGGPPSEQTQGNCQGPLQQVPSVCTTQRLSQLLLPWTILTIYLPECPLLPPQLKTPLGTAFLIVELLASPSAQ